MKTLHRVLLLLVVVACNQSPKQQQEQAVAPPSASQVVPTFVIKEVKKQSDDEIPQVEVSLQLGEKTMSVAKVNACALLPKEEYAQYEIPSGALAACGGWYAGAGDYFYITENATHWLVMQGWQDEQQTDKGYHYSQKLSVVKQ